MYKSCILEVEVAHHSRFRDQCWEKTSTAPLEEAPEHSRHLQHGGYASDFVLQGSTKKPKILNKDQMVKKKDNTHSLDF